MNFEKQSTGEQKGVRNDAISVNPSYRVSCKMFGGCIQIAMQMERFVSVGFFFFLQTIDLC